MGRRRESFVDLLDLAAARVKGPVCLAMGSPGEVVDLLPHLPGEGTVCYQMDLYQAERIRNEQLEVGANADITVKPDLWDLHADYQTVIFPVPLGGERALKLDIIEQAYHVLKPGGSFIVLSPYEKDDLFQPALKKVFGKVHCPMGSQNSVFWCQRDGERPRRRHEMSYHVRVDANTSLSFLSRPGVFSYGRFDHGARALCEAMEIPEAARIADIGCGVGTNGILAARKAGPDAFVAFLDSNVRALSVAQLNAHHMGVPRFATYPTADVTGPEEHTFDVVLANPPYYAHLAIARLFLRRGRKLLKRGGALYLVTKQIENMQPLVEEEFGQAEIYENRGYFIFVARP
jgi:16S rRNA (guanine1207-N2)-methyltransferase